MQTTDNRPWLRYYGEVPTSIDYPRITLYEAVAATAQRLPEAIAWDFFGTTATYRELLASIDACANALAALGLKAGDRLLISMPTAPAGVIAVYAANKLGVVPALIHPLSTETEIEQYLNDTGARVALTLDAFYRSVRAGSTPGSRFGTSCWRASATTCRRSKHLGFWLTKGRKIAPVPTDAAGGLVEGPDGGLAPDRRRAPRPRLTIPRRSCSPAAPPASRRVSYCRTGT